MPISVFLANNQMFYQNILVILDGFAEIDYVVNRPNVVPYVFVSKKHSIDVFTDLYLTITILNTFISPYIPPPQIPPNSPLSYLSRGSFLPE